MRLGTVYTETTLYLAPERFQADVPYQVAIVSLNDGGRLTARIIGEAVAIGDRVVETESADGIPLFRKAV